MRRDGLECTHRNTNRPPAKELDMNAQTTRRATALSLATLLTLGILASIDFMATSPAPNSLLAATEAPASQVIVIEAKRRAS